MKVIVSVQAKRGSSRGLVHYISHSKIDHEREPEKGRELFNRFADNLSVESANNSLKNDTSRKRPGNDQLHHLVLSFRREDFAKFGYTGSERRKALKDITRAALGRLEEKLNADRLAWAAAVHLNTANPHVHIALRKTYFTHDFQEKVLTKIPREAIPHNIKTSDQKNEFVRGYLAEGAAQKMDEIIERTLARPRPKIAQHEHEKTKGTDANRMKVTVSSSRERKLLRDWLLLKYELRSSEERISMLMQHGYRLHFVVDDTSMGKRHRLSLHDIDIRAEKRALMEAKAKGISNPREIEILKRLEVKSEKDRNAPAIRQIHAILRDLVTKEEANRTSVHYRFKQADKEVNKIRAKFRRIDRKLPLPSLSKDEVDRLQEQALSMSDIRGFGYLERVREELTGSGEIAERDARDLERLSIQKAIFELRSAAHQKDLQESRANRYSRVLKIDGAEWSIQSLDKRGKERTEKSRTFGGLVSRFESFLFGDKSDDLPDREEIKNRVLEKLDTEDRELVDLRNQEAKKQKMLEKILDRHGAKRLDVRDISELPELTELESLSSRLKAVDAYKESWEMMQRFVERADTSCSAAKRVADNTLPKSFQNAFDHEKTRTIAGRALAKEIVSRIQLAEANENLERFSAVKRFHKFEIKDPRSGTREFVCLNDVETHHGSFLDQAVVYVLESKQQRQARRLVKNAVTKRENYLKSEVGSAVEMVKAASQVAAEYKDVHFFGLKTTTDYKPIFTASGLSFIERRIDRSENRSEIKSLEKILSAAHENRVDSLGHLLKDFTPTADHVVLQPEKTRDAAPDQVHHHDRVKESQKIAGRSQDRTHDREGMVR